MVLDIFWNAHFKIGQLERDNIHPSNIAMIKEILCEADNILLVL